MISLFADDMILHKGDNKMLLIMEQFNPQYVTHTGMEYRISLCVSYLFWKLSFLSQLFDMSLHMFNILYPEANNTI
jgi:hypothetical protein